MAGDPEEWGAWLERHGATLVLLARQRVTSRADAEDIVQEAFVRFWRSRHRADDPTAYLYTCVQRCALNWQRSRERRSRREGVAARPEAETLLAGPPEQEERREAIEAGLRGLPETQREVLVMKVWGGLSFPQIAEALRIPANTAASRYRYALARLRERLAEEPNSMNETPDPLEAELAAFRPHEISPELRRRVAGRLAGFPARKNRRLWTIALASGLAAACLAALFFGRGSNTGPDIVGPPAAPSGRTDDALPSLRAYRQALARSPEDLDALLDKHAARGSEPDHQLMRIRAFNRPDLEVQAFSGEL